MKIGDFNGNSDNLNFWKISILVSLIIVIPLNIYLFSKDTNLLYKILYDEGISDNLAIDISYIIIIIILSMFRCALLLWVTNYLVNGKYLMKKYSGICVTQVLIIGIIEVWVMYIKLYM